MCRSSTGSWSRAGRRRACPSTACYPGVGAALGLEATRQVISPERRAHPGRRPRPGPRPPERDRRHSPRWWGGAAQPDSDRLRVWELAGASHADTLHRPRGAPRRRHATARAHRRAGAPLRGTCLSARRDYADQRRASSSTTWRKRRSCTWFGAGGRGEKRRHPAPSLELDERPNGVRPGRARHCQGWDPHPVGRRADRRHGRPRGVQARPSPCSSAAQSPSTMRLLSKLYPGGEDDYSGAPSPPHSIRPSRKVSSWRRTA